MRRAIAGHTITGSARTLAGAAGPRLFVVVGGARPHFQYLARAAARTTVIVVFSLVMSSSSPLPPPLPVLPSSPSCMTASLVAVT
jgi:hypothetical protein